MKRFCLLIKPAIKDEQEAIDFYVKLRSIQDSKPIKLVLDSIIYDERKHLNLFKQIDRIYCK